jgi:biopolymer transport protein TolQ
MPNQDQGLQAESLAETADVAVQAAASHGADSMSIISLITEASLTVQMVMLLLLLASLFSWSIIFSKFFSLR